MHCTEPVILERQMNSFGKNSSLIRTFIHVYCEILNMKLNIWLDIPSKYKKDPCVFVLVTVGIILERLTDTSSQDFSLWFFTYL